MVRLKADPPCIIFSLLQQYLLFRSYHKLLHPPAPLQKSWHFMNTSQGNVLMHGNSILLYSFNIPLTLIKTDGAQTIHGMGKRSACAHIIHTFGVVHDL